MRNLKNMILAGLMIALAACSGLSARQEALLPAMQLAWQGVEPDVRAGIDESELAQRVTPTAAAALRADAGKLGEGIASGNPATIAAVAWAPLAESANFGLDKRVERNEISTGVAGSLRERLRNFGEGLTVFLERR